MHKLWLLLQKKDNEYYNLAITCYNVGLFVRLYSLPDCALDHISIITAQGFLYLKQFKIHNRFDLSTMGRIYCGYCCKPQWTMELYRGGGDIRCFEL